MINGFTSSATQSHNKTWMLYVSPVGIMMVVGYQYQTGNKGKSYLDFILSSYDAQWRACDEQQYWFLE